MGKTTKYTNYINAWNKAHTKQVIIRFNTEKDKDLLDHLEKMGKAPYIKRLIRDDMAKECYNKTGA